MPILAAVGKAVSYGIVKTRTFTIHKLRNQSKRTDGLWAYSLHSKQGLKILRHTLISFCEYLY